jgi:hypothetical protein
MAHMTQELKKELAPRIKAVLKKYNMKGTIGVRNNVALVVNLSSGAIDFKPAYGYEQVNHYYICENYEGNAAAFLNELKSAMMVGNHDQSDSQIDYFDVGWYISINIGKYDKHYKYIPVI